MDIVELYDLYNFSKKYIKPLCSNWSNLHSGLQNNATQAQKQPLRDFIDSVESELQKMPIEALSSAQIAWLDSLDVSHLLDPSGIRELRQLLDASTFDPATAAADAALILNALQSADTRLRQIGEALSGYEWITKHPALTREEVEVRFIFQKDFNVQNPTDLKKASNELNDILRGFAISVDQRVEDISITSVSKGSLIVTLATTTLITTLLAKAVSHVTGMALDALRVASAYEELRHKRILTKQLEKQLKDEEKKIEQEGRKELIEKMIDELGEITPENRAKLEISIEKIFDLFQKGGDIEFLEPPKMSEDEYEELSDDGLRERLDEIRTHRREVLLLTSQVVT